MKLTKKQIFLFVLVVSVFLFVKYFIFSSSVNNYNFDIYNYRAYSLINNKTDEHGRTLPLVFQSRLSYEMPLNSYLYSLSFLFLNKFNLAEFGYEIFLTLLLIFSTYYLTKSKSSVFFITLCPYFLWPGNWTEKLFIAFSFLAIRFFKSDKPLPLFLTSLLLLLTSTISFSFFIIFLINVFLQKKIKIFWKVTFILSVILIIFLKNFNSLPYSKNYLTNQNINIVNNIEYKNAVNQLRGEDSQTSFQSFSRLLHNKLSIFTSIISYSIRNFDPSLWFFNGDNTNSSNRQLVPIFYPLFVLLIFFIPLQIKKNKFLILTIIISTILIGLNGEISQSRLLIVIPFVFILFSSIFDNLQTKIKYLFFVISILSFLPMIKIIVNHQPKSVFAYSNVSGNSLVEFIKQNPDKHIYITDEVYPDLGPQLKLLLKILPMSNSSTNYSPYIRDISEKVSIISPNEKMLNRETYQEINQKDLNSIFLVSPAQSERDSHLIFKIFTPIIYQNINTPIFYEMRYEIPKK